MKTKLGLTLIVIVIFGAIGWGSIGPDWRSFLSDPPTDANILFWNHNQRTNAFRMMDRVKILADSNTIEANENVRTLDISDPLKLDMDFEAYFKNQNHSAVIILHNGEIRLEKYGLDFSEQGRWTSFSVAKSLTSTLVGVAIKDGSIESLDDKVSTYIPGLAGSAYDDVSIEQLLTMSSGVAWNEDYDDPSSDVARFRDHRSTDGLNDLVSYMKKLPRKHEPGTVWNYSTGETNLIGILVIEATGRSLSEYLSEKIWKPYGMSQKATWLLDSNGLEISGCCIQAKTRDFARFGQFILEGAEINGKSILPEGWIASATTKQIDIGRPNEGYGYQWWTMDDGPYLARGIFGQRIFIDPARQLVVATNSSWTQATGLIDGENKKSADFFRTVQMAIDAEQ